MRGFTLRRAALAGEWRVGLLGARENEELWPIGSCKPGTTALMHTGFAKRRDRGRWRGFASSGGCAREEQNICEREQTGWSNAQGRFDCDSRSLHRRAGAPVSS